MLRKRISHPVDIETLERRLFDKAATSTELIDEYYRFGQILFTEMGARAAEIERKTITMLGWSIAALGFFLLKDQTKAAQWTKYLAGIGIIAAFIAVVVCGVALRSRMWAVPSEQDWFRDGIKDHDELKRYHVISLAVAHQNQNPAIGRKAYLLGVAELLVLLAAALVAILATNALL